MARPVVHLICNAHLDPVWQWRWEEGCAEALSTFGNAVSLLREHAGLIFNHNESVLYEWVRRHDPRLFREIQRVVRAGRWCISGGWYLQPDVNMPGVESLVRHIEVGRRFFLKYFGKSPAVAYNFDSFGHCGGLPQVLRAAGYRMYIHMRPHESELPLPADLYRWKGVDGTEIPAYRIAVGLYHSERDNIVERLREGTDLALKLQRDVPVFWGIGNHGGGPSRDDLVRIDEFFASERRVRFVHSTPELLERALRKYARTAPVVEGDIQRTFTGCYTSLARVKLRAQQGLANLVQAEAVATAAWWLRKKEFPAAPLQDAWHDHLFNDFHDILPGSCTEPAEHDALDLYGRASETLRRVRLEAVAALNAGNPRPAYVPVTVVNSNTSFRQVPVEVECMLDLRPKWTGSWYLTVRTLDGREIPCQEEQPECLLPFNGWRRKVVFMDSLPGLGASRYEIRINEGENAQTARPAALRHTTDELSGLVRSLTGADGKETLAGPLMQPIVVRDEGDSWGAECWSYRDVLGRFEPVKNSFRVLHAGPVRTVAESIFSFGASRVACHTIAYAELPMLEYRLRVTWNESRRRLKLSIPTLFRSGPVLCEVPGGAIARPADGQEHVHGRWCALQGNQGGTPVVFAVVHTGLHGLDCKEGEIRLSALRGAAYCHEKGFQLDGGPSRKFMDQGIHEFRLLVTAGPADEVLGSVAGLADWLCCQPAVYAHLPIGGTARGGKGVNPVDDLLDVSPRNIRLLSCRPSADKRSLFLRLQETAGRATRAGITLHQARRTTPLLFKPYEIVSVRIARNGRVRRAGLLDEKP